MKYLVELFATLEIFTPPTANPPQPPHSLALQDGVTLKENLHVLGGFPKCSHTNNSIRFLPIFITIQYLQETLILFPFFFRPQNNTTSCFAPLLLSINCDGPCRACAALEKAANKSPVPNVRHNHGAKTKGQSRLARQPGKGQGEARRRRTGERSTGAGEKMSPGWSGIRLQPGAARPVISAEGLGN